jgi:glycosyltransferase involved in cell wall biosynthesis
MGLPEDGLLDRTARRLAAKTIFTCSEYVAGLQRAKQPAANIVAVHLGVDLQRFDGVRHVDAMSAREQLGLPAEGPLIGIVGRLQSWKGMHVLMDALPIVLKSHPDAHCVIVGGEYPAEAGYLGQLKSRCQHLGVSRNVIFAGAQGNVPLWMQAMDVFVHASTKEPFGIVVVEAMALGKAVIGSVPGGPKEIIIDGINGSLVPSEDCVRLANSIRLFLGDSTLRRQCGDQARIHAVSQFSCESYATRLCDALIKIDDRGDK